MEHYLWFLVLILSLAVLLLLWKVYLLKRSAREIGEAFADRLGTDTNLLISISSRDRSMRRLADHINKELRLLRSLRRQYQQGDRRLKEAVINISHDIRTPLTAICGYLELLGQKEQTEETMRYLGVIRERTQVLKLLTEELFSYSMTVPAQYEEGNKTAREIVILNQALEESILTYYGAFKEARIEPVISMTRQKLSRRLDPKALSRVLGNLISNAIKYSDGDLTVTLEENGRMTFSNHASRLDKIQVGNLFDRFYTVEDARESAGLGLSIARMLTEQMGGTMSADYQGGMLHMYVWFPDQDGSLRQKKHIS